MKNKNIVLNILIVSSLALISCNANADIFSDILYQLEQQTTLQQAIPQISQLQQQTINQLMTTPGLNFSSEGFNSNLQSWGSNVSSWNSVLQAYQQGGNGLGSISQQLNQQFPIAQSNVANPNSSSIDAQYYTLKAQTALAARSASQYDYNNIQNQINYMHQLLSMINETKTLKDAMDLQNRIQVEGNLIQLEILRQESLSNQQQAIESQGESNTAVNTYNSLQ